VKHLSRAEIEKMKKSMKKVPEIQLKSDIYHEHEITEAENILGKISIATETKAEHIIEQNMKHT